MAQFYWESLRKLQLGKYAEYYAKMEFAKYGFEVYTSEVDDHGIDFVAKCPETSKFYEVQVKSKRPRGSIFVNKDDMTMDEYHLLCCICFGEKEWPDVYAIPMTEWENKDNYPALSESNGIETKPAWTVNFSKRNSTVLDKFKIDQVLNEIKRREIS